MLDSSSNKNYLQDNYIRYYQLVWFQTDDVFKFQEMDLDLKYKL